MSSSKLLALRTFQKKYVSLAQTRIIGTTTTTSTTVVGGVTAAAAAAAGLLYADQLERRTERAHETYATNTMLAAVVDENNGGGAPSSVTTTATPVVLPREYDRFVIERYWEQRPITVSRRVLDTLIELMPLVVSYLCDFRIRPFLFGGDSSSSSSSGDSSSSSSGGDTSEEANDHDLETMLLQRSHASALREALTRLGPAFVKAGQQLSIRPDLVPGPVLKELQLLCDSVTPVADQVAMKVLCDELGLQSVEELSYLFEGGRLQLVAAASLGQVYKATLVDTKEQVAIKVQRPDMVRQVSLDLFLLRKIAKLMDAFTNTFTEQAPYHVNLFETFAKGSYSELDYENEAANQRLFMEEFQKRRSNVFIPAVHTQFSSRKVITTEWVDGVKLADADPTLIRRLIPVGVELFLTQLLDMGRFHADPHPGNLYVTTTTTATTGQRRSQQTQSKQTGGEAQLCLLDFGLCARVEENDTHAMTAAIVHLLIGDFESLVSEDAKKLGFLPHSMDTTELLPILTKILTQGLLEPGSNLHDRKHKLGQISNELNEVFFRYPFTVPPFFALITRGLGLLEGIALSGDPDFDIFQASYPYARKRAVEIFGQHGINQMKRKMTTRQQA